MTRLVAVGLAALAGAGCFRGKLPPREFYRLTPVEASASGAARTGPPPLTGAMVITSYNTPGIYGSGSIVYRVGESAYGAYPSREWAIPLGEMLGALTEETVRRVGLTSGTVTFEPVAARSEEYEWRATVREFDEVDTPTSVSASVVLAAQLVRAVDDSVLWTGSAKATEGVRETRSMQSVVAALSIAAGRAIRQLVEEAAATLRGVPASGARTH